MAVVVATHPKQLFAVFHHSFALKLAIYIHPRKHGRDRLVAVLPDDRASLLRYLPRIVVSVSIFALYARVRVETNTNLAVFIRSPFLKFKSKCLIKPPAGGSLNIKFLKYRRSCPSLFRRYTLRQLYIGFLTSRPLVLVSSFNPLPDNFLLRPRPFLPRPAVSSPSSL